MNTPTTEERIVIWNEERNLIPENKEVQLIKEMSFIVEELIEMSTNLKSDEARELAEELASKIKDPNYTPSKEQIVDAAGDIVVFALGLIRKLGYNPKLAMNEVLLEIETRRGNIIEGKFVKDKSPEAQALWYKANFDNALID